MLLLGAEDVAVLPAGAGVAAALAAGLGAHRHHGAAVRTLERTAAPAARAHGNRSSRT